MNIRGRRVYCTGALALLLTGPSSAFAQTVEGTQATQALELTPKSTPATDEGLSRPFSHLFQDTLTDFRRLPSRETWTWLTIGAAAATLTHSSDQSVSESLSSSKFFGETLKAGEVLGSAGVQHGSAVATYLIGRVTNKPRVTQVGADLIQAQMIAQVLTSAVKIGVGRTRPDGTGQSFPSGHSSVTFATATVLQRDLGWKVGIPAYALATYVAASRIQVKRHFLSDVAFGAAIGIVAGRTVTVGRGEARFAVSPMAAPSGGGVSFDWIGSRR